MLIGLKIFITGVTLYAGIRFTGIAIAWLKEFFDELAPRKRDRY